MPAPLPEASFSDAILGFLKRSGTERSTPRLVAEMFHFIASTFAVDRVSLFLATGEHGALRPYVSEFGSGTADRAMFEDWKSIDPEQFELTTRIRAGEPVVSVLDPQAPGGLPRDVVERFGIKPFTGFELRSEDRLQGVLMIEGDPEILRARHDQAADFARYVALALANARAFEAEKQRASDAQALLEVGEVLTRTTELTPVLASVAQNCATVTGFERCSVFLIDEASGRLKPVMSQFADGHVDAEAWERFISSDGETPVGLKVLRDGEPIALEEPEERPDLIPPSWIEPFDIKSMLFLPLTAWDQKFGILVLDRRHRGAISGRQMQMARGVASQGAAAISLTRSLATERNAATRLRELDQLKSTFVAAVSHELRTPLTTIIGFSDLLTDRVVDSEAAGFVDLIRRESAHLEALISNLLVTSQMEAGMLDLRLGRVNLTSIVVEASDLVGRLNPGRTVSLDMDEVLTLESADADRLRQVFINLIENAAKYSPADTPINISAHLDGDQFIRVEITDEGPGIPNEEKQAVFDRFRRGKGHDQSGTGIGLYLVRALVETHEGNVWVEDRPGEEGARFVVTLPVVMSDGGAERGDAPLQVPEASAA